MNDIAGTGYFSSEYIVLTDFYDRFEYSFGVGWGEMTGGLRFRNPFIESDDKFQKIDFPLQKIMVAHLVLKIIFLVMMHLFLLPFLMLFQETQNYY